MKTIDAAQRTYYSAASVVSSQVAQDLPYLDRRNWLKQLTAPETIRERTGRHQRYLASRLGDGPTSLVAAERWTANWRNSR